MLQVKKIVVYTLMFIGNIGHRFESDRDPLTNLNRLILLGFFIYKQLKYALFFSFACPEQNISAIPKHLVLT